MKEILIALCLIAAVTVTESHAYSTPHEQQQQILIHGAGGCTPNFSTGGCL